MKKITQNGKELQKMQQEALYELNKATLELVKTKRKNRKFIIIIIILILTLIKVFFGTIQLNNFFGYPSSIARYYEVMVNKTQVSVNYQLKHTIPIIPFFINFNSYYLGNSYIKGGDVKDYINKIGNDKYIISINSYNCFSQNNNYQIECKNSEQVMKKNNDTKYSQVRITRTSNPYEVTYQGIFISDISSYITENGIYHIEITAKHGLVESKIYFYIKNKI